MDRPSLPRAPPPFSLVEFGSLVSAALDSPDPILFSSPVSYASSSTAALHDAVQSDSYVGVRQMLSKFKKRASALVKRPSSTTQPRAETRAQSPEYRHRIPELRLSASLHTDEDADDAFVPYLPLVTRYERAARSMPSLPTQCSSHAVSQSHYHAYATHSNASHSSFASPTSSSFPSPSLSANSTSSCSSASSSSYPTTPLTTVSKERRWSVCTSTSSAADENPIDPFAKPLYVVPASAPGSSNSKSNSNPGFRPRPRRLLPLAPAPAPAPAPPLPLPLPPVSVSMPSREGQRQRHPYDLPPLPSPTLSSNSSRTRTQSHRAKKKTVRSLLDAFPAPPTFTPTPPTTPARTGEGRFAAQQMQTPPWLDPESSSASISYSPPSRSRTSHDSGSWHSEVDEDGDVFHSACSGSF
ncbi:hypothetical protein B0H19DRAFT_1256926 [Mycena capillaripes]|nr:hypothetical protein B0H19DRAFT_1256926 [Mycena capillaripes]